MKKIIYILFILFLSCNSKSNNNNSVDEQVILQSSYKNRFFDFDEVVHYKNDLKDEREIFRNQKKSKLDKLKFNVIIQYDFPKSIKGTLFIDKLNDIGFKKTTISKLKFETINNIFSKKYSGEYPVAACILLYRDILIFKKKSKIVGMAKICFGCGANYIVGTNVNTDNFGQSGDYQKLETLLKEKK